MKLPTVDEILEIIDFDPTKDLEEEAVSDALRDLETEFSNILDKAYDSYIERRNKRQRTRDVHTNLDALADAMADFCLSLSPDENEDNRDKLKNEASKCLNTLMPFFTELADHVKSTEVDGNTTTVRECSINKNLQDALKRALEEDKKKSF